MNIRRQFKMLAGAMALTVLSAASHAASVVFDNMTAPETGVSGASLNATSSTPNTFMGDGYILAAGTTSITGFDLFAYNNTGTTYTNLKLTVFVWDNVNTGTVSAATPAFSNLLGTYTVTSAADTFTSGFFYSFEGDGSTTPGISLTTPLALSDTTVGLTFNIQGSTNGVTYASANNLTSLISYGVAPTAGSESFNGYYRNAASESNGNFTSTLRSLGFTNQSVGVRVFGTSAVSVVPEPGAYLMMGLGLALFTVMRRRQAR